MDDGRRSLRTSGLAAVLLAVGLGALAAAGIAAAADMSKKLRASFPVAETGFDPQAVSDLYSNEINRAIFEPLLAVDYIARPYRLVPLAAEAMPEITDGGLTYTIRLKKGLYYSDDPVFKGRRRELVAEDFVYGWKRMADPRLRSPHQVYAAKIAGFDALTESAKKDNRLDYALPWPGVEAVDRYTLRVRLKEPNYNFLNDLTQPAMSPMAREVVEAYADGSGMAMANPVGTGPYRLKDWRRGQRIVLEANPGFRDEFFPESDDPADRDLVARMKGKKLPLVGTVEVSIIEESQPRLLAFKANELDYFAVPSDLIERVLDGDTLKPEFAGRQVIWTRMVEPALSYNYFNMDDPVVGGYSKEKVALRRAILMGFNTDEYVKVIFKGNAIPATQPTPPDLPGHWKNRKRITTYDPDLAKALLDRFGYVDRDGDGFRELPDGKPLVIVKASTPDGRGKEDDELWKKSMDAIGIRLEFLKQKWPDLLKMGKAGQLQMWGLGWIANVPDGQTFYSMLYSPYIGQRNYSRFKLDAFDRLYEKTNVLPDGPERFDLYRQMGDYLAVYAPWDYGVYRIRNTLIQPWIRGYKQHVFLTHNWKYYDVDLAQRGAAK